MIVEADPEGGLLPTLDPPTTGPPMPPDISWQGEWWLPGGADQKVYGTLHFSQEDGGHLELFGPLRPLGVGDREHPSVILGQRLDGPRTTCSLVDTIRIQGNSMTGGPQLFRVNQVYEGVHLDADERLTARQVSVRPKFLTQWIDKSVIEQRIPRRDPLTIYLSAVEPADERHAFGDGYEVILHRGVGVSGDDYSYKTIEETHRLSVRVEEAMTTEDLQRLAAHLQALISIGTNRIAEYEEVRFLPSGGSSNSTGPAGTSPFSLHAQWTARDDGDQDLAPHQCIFRYSDLGGIEAVARWMSMATTHAESILRLMSTKYSGSMYASDRLLGRAAALEALDRVDNTARSTFRERIERCANGATPAIAGMLGDVTEWSQAVKDQRDDIAHHIGRHSGYAGSTHYFVAESLYWVAVSCLLRASEAGQQALNALDANRTIRWLTPRVQEAIADTNRG